MLYRLVLAVGLMAATGAASAPVNFFEWQAEEPRANGNWVPRSTIRADPSNPDSEDISTDVIQTIRGRPTVFLSDIRGIAASSTMFARVNTGAGDDDFFGFVIGFQSGDFSNPAADYLLVDWKKGAQALSGVFAPAGIRLSRVTGTPSDAEFFGATDITAGDGSGVTQLAAGRNIGWVYGVEYRFDFTYGADPVDPTRMRFGLTVCHGATCVQEFDQVLDSPVYGSFGFYTYSQGGVVYRSTDINGTIPQYVPLPGTAAMPVPLPAAAWMLLAALGALAGLKRRG